MSIFKRQKKKERKEAVAPTKTKAEKEVAKEPTPNLRVDGPRSVLYPLLTEKATDLQTENKYVFVVSSGANKPEIKKEIERIFDVKVEGVTILKAKRKARLWRGIRGHRSGYKKAIVTIGEGKKIEILPA